MGTAPDRKGLQTKVLDGNAGVIINRDIVLVGFRAVDAVFEASEALDRWRWQIVVTRPVRLGAMCTRWSSLVTFDAPLSELASQNNEKAQKKTLDHSTKGQASRSGAAYLQDTQPARDLVCEARFRVTDVFDAVVDTAAIR